MIDKELHDKLKLTCDMLTDCTRELFHSGHDLYARKSRNALTVMQEVRDGVEKLLVKDDKKD